jgi:glycosyltransferase involved in cell wall biosynthesis
MAAEALRRIYVAERPDLVHHFTIKAILYGTLAAKWSGVPRVVNSVTGLGYIFLSDRLPVRAIRPLLRTWYSRSVAAPGVRSIFQNADDLAQLSMGRPIVSAYATLANGSGVDIERFVPDVDTAGSEEKRPCVLFAGRLIREKGIHEFVQAARLLRECGSAAEFVACGSPDPGNPSSVKPEELKQWQREGVVEFAGHVEQMEARLKGVDVVALPSYYREGRPRALIEAAAAGKPSITCDVAGCRDVVLHGKTGLLIPPRDAPALASAIGSLLDDGPTREAMGLAARQHAVEMYDERQVTSQIINLYTELSSVDDPRWEDRRPTAIPKGVFLFSLDCGLAWGENGQPPGPRGGPCLEAAHAAISRLLDLFAKYGIPGTWATVGTLLVGGHDKQPQYTRLSSKVCSDVLAGDWTAAPAWFAESILEGILECPVAQEIACHGLTHEIVRPGSDGRCSFARDLQGFRGLADEFLLEKPVTFIYPRHVMAHFDVLAQNGFRCIRGALDDWFEKLPGKAARAGLRLIDAMLARPPHVGLPRRLPCGLWVLPPSQFYAPRMGVGKHVSVEARVRKAVKGLRMAAKRKAIFHLWTHPFNLGVGTDDLLRGLDTILAEARHLADAGEIEITTMGELAAQLEQERRPTPRQNRIEPS